MAGFLVKSTHRTTKIHWKLKNLKMAFLETDQYVFFLFKWKSWTFMDGHWPIQDLAVFLHDALVVIEMKRGGFWFWRISAWILLACFDSDQLWAVQRLKATWAGLRRPFMPSGTGLLWLVRGLSYIERFGFCGLILLPFEMVRIKCACRPCVTNFRKSCKWTSLFGIFHPFYA